jgi:predicted GIY-YIG superfamily endonuclease
MKIHPAFTHVIESLQPSFERLINQQPISPVKVSPNVPPAGIYLFSEGDNHLYVGRSNNLRRRMQRHGSPGATHKQAAFAFRLAREATGNLKATYKTEGSRDRLIEDPEFKAAFTSAKARIRNMQLRYVEESDPLRQAVLEMYVAVALATPYNDFDNH